MSVIAYSMNRHLALCEIYVALDEVDRKFFRFLKADLG
jgi:hypothetical protein